MVEKIRVTVWHEYRHEKISQEVRSVYPDGMHAVLAAALTAAGDMQVRTATQDDPDHGLTDEVLANTDVLTWWGHKAHHEVRDDIVAKVHQRVLAGMGLLVLHSAHYSKIFNLLMGTSCSLKWREANDREILWFTAPGHPILAGLSDHIIIPREEMYGEHFDVPEPDETVLISSFTGGEVFRSGLVYRRGAGRIFYFRPGHETYPTYHQKEIQQIIINAVRFLKPAAGSAGQTYGHRQPLA